MTSSLPRLLSIAAGLLAAGHAWAASMAPPAQGTFRTLVRAESVVEAVAGDSGPQRKATDEPLQLDSQHKNEVVAAGSEKTPCGEPGRRSAGTSSITSRVSRAGDSALDMRLGVRTFAQGGHFKACAGCERGRCIGGPDFDTRARASASVALLADVAFLPELPEAPYHLIVRHELEGNGVERTVSLVDAAGKTRPVPSGEQISIVGGRGRTYRLRIELKSGSADSGACCSDEKVGSLSAQVILAPAPQVVSSIEKIGPEIRRSVSNEPAVGLLISRGKRGEPVPACTGTVIGSKTILTAAHCLEFYQAKPDLLFVPGGELLANLGRAVRIIEWIRPSDEFEGGYRYRIEKGRAVDDIALLYTDAPIDVEPASPVRENLSDADFVQLGTFAELLTFITLEERDTKFLGEDARQVASKASLGPPDRRTARVSARGMLCTGWSGAPVMAVGSKGTRVVVALTTAGESDCQRAEALRMDAYWPWLAAKIR